jgi:hypothetical protein
LQRNDLLSRSTSQYSPRIYYRCALK